MSTSSSSSAPSSSSSSTGCTGSCHCDPVTGVDCSNCGGDCYCKVPEPIPFSFDVPCEEFVPFGFNAVPVAETPYGAKAAPPMVAYVRVPVVSNPSQWKNIQKAVSSPLVRLPLPSIGWDFTFIKNPSGPASPLIAPATVPANPIAALDKVLACSIILPESSGFQQYWVPVTESLPFLGKRLATLQTAEWTVIVLRDPA